MIEPDMWIHSWSRKQARPACRTIDVMSSMPRPTLRFYRRPGCEPCTEARATLQWVLEDRATRGEVVPQVRDIDVTDDPELEARYGALVPVVVIGEHELPLVMSGRQLRAFLDATLPRIT